MKGKLDAEMDEEMRSHVEMQTQANIAEGMNPEEARFAALRNFGWAESIKEDCRDGRGMRLWENLGQDIRFGIRQLRKNPGFTTVAVLTLALGIGVNTSMFSGLQSLLLPKLPYPEPDRLVRLFRTSPHSQRSPHSAANFLDQQEQNSIFERMAALSLRSFNLAEPGQPAELLRGVETTSDFIPLLGLPPQLGRTFSAEEDQPGRNQVLLISHNLWVRRFSADPGIIGRNVRLDGQTATIIGVMPPVFQNKMQWGKVDVVRPIAFTGDQRNNRSGHYLISIGRLKQGVSLAQARVGMGALSDRLRQDHPEENADTGLAIFMLAESGMDPRGRIMVWLMMGLAGFVLLIACANLANLQFGRTTLRMRELAIRGALGAPPKRLLLQLLTESLLIAVLGGLLGLLLAVWGNEALRRQLTFEGETMLDLRLNLRVLAFTLSISTLTGLAFGLLPAWMASRANANHMLKQGSRGSTGDRTQHRLRHSLIVAQVALALMLLTGAGLLVGGLRNFGVRDPGWRVDGLTVGYLNLPDGKYTSEKLRSAFAENLLESLRTISGVEKAAVAGSLPISGFRRSDEFISEEQAGDSSVRRKNRNVNVVSPNYFTTLGMRFLEGRDFDASDNADHPGSVIINESLARALWPATSAIGKRIGTPGNWLEIVGVVNDARFPSDPGEPATLFQSYRPLAQEPQSNLAIALRGRVSIEALRKTVASLDSEQPVNEPGTARAAVSRVLDQAAIAGWLLSGFAGLGLVLAALGIYGVIAGFVVQRTNEIGVRMALGAQISDVLRLVLVKGLRLTLAGSALGLLGAIALTRLLQSLAPGLESNSPIIVASLAGLLIIVATFASWIPARRASRVDPMVALRNE